MIELVHAYPTFQIPCYLSMQVFADISGLKSVTFLSTTPCLKFLDLVLEFDPSFFTTKLRCFGVVIIF